MFKSVFFELGREVVTPGIYGAMESSREFALETGAECQKKTKR